MAPKNEGTERMKFVINEESLFQKAMASRLQKRNRKQAAQQAQAGAKTQKQPPPIPADDSDQEVDDSDVVGSMSDKEDKFRTAYAINWLERTLEYKAWRGVLLDMAKDIIEDALEQAGVGNGKLASDGLKDEVVKETAKKVWDRFTSAMSENLPEDAREFLTMNESLDLYIYKHCLNETKKAMKSF
jgi:hypothetical protein